MAPPAPPHLPPPKWCWPACSQVRVPRRQTVPPVPASTAAASGTDMLVSLWTLKTGRRVSPLPQLSQHHRRWPLSEGGPAPASSSFVGVFGFFCFALRLSPFSVCLAQHTPLQTLGLAFSFGALPKKVPKPRHVRGHRLLGMGRSRPHLMDENTEASQGPGDVPKATGQ